MLEKVEKGVSGSKVSASKRDVIQELRSEASKGNFDILLVYMFERLGRIDSETPFVLEWFVQHGIQMWSTHEGQQRIESHGDKLMNYTWFWQAAGGRKDLHEYQRPHQSDRFQRTLCRRLCSLRISCR